ncbi:hypothetical protein PV517_32470 [Streptomyces griseiscabiei]|uniref:Uncharacterized protein n=1 Tax=Streptomyces griseiscabiei TaxID=2993540 RepID=A0ABU4LC69_9ACTN|nr:hypothetical protein [Streptomyces griseiscabiei]MBZ3901138.1 hypothetical protein [Streptomyces griseiscabiei]MDX2913370.1 hypothetical protein [Streptomyces griseiscabiei]
MPAWVTTVPLGRPVVPEVWMTYAAWSPRRTTPGFVSGSPWPRARTVASSRTRFARESATRYAIRSAGYPVSTGTYAAPVFSTAHSATISSGERGSFTATRDSGPTPRPRRACASRFTRALSSPYVSRSPSKTTASAAGSWASKRSTRVRGSVA